MATMCEQAGDDAKAKIVVHCLVDEQIIGCCIERIVAGPLGDGVPDSITLVRYGGYPRYSYVRVRETQPAADVEDGVAHDGSDWQHPPETIAQVRAKLAEAKAKLAIVEASLPEVENGHIACFDVPRQPCSIEFAAGCRFVIEQVRKAMGTPI